MKKVLGLAAIAVAVVSAGTLAGIASPAASGCIVQLRVNVFGGFASWALQAGLGTGQLATLRATALGCAGLDHITRVRVAGSGPAAAPISHPCAGTVCDWQQRSPIMQAFDYQAFGTDAAGNRKRSNIVRVAWGGSDAVVGTWTWRWAQPGSPMATHGTVEFFPDHTMKWSGGKTGDWERAGNTLTLTWRVTPVGRDMMTVSADGRTMVGTNDQGWAVQGIKQ